MSEPDLFTVKVFKVPKNEIVGETSSPEQTKQNRSIPLNDIQIIEEHHNMTSARVIRVSSLTLIGFIRYLKQIRRATNVSMTIYFFKTG